MKDNVTGAGFIAVVDGSQGGLPDVPLRTINAGRVNRSPAGEPISVIMGTNTDEFALFIIGIALVIPGATLPISDATINANASISNFPRAPTCSVSTTTTLPPRPSGTPLSCAPPSPPSPSRRRLSRAICLGL